MTMKKMLLLGGSAQQIVAIETAKRLGLYTVLCDYLPDNPGQYHADKFYLVSTTDKEAVLDVARKESVDYVIAYASDPAAPVAAYVAEKLALPANPFRSVEILCNKDKFRAFLREHGFNVPDCKSYSDPDEAKSDELDIEYPVIVKPVDSSGSKGVTVVYHQSELNVAIDFAFSFSRSNRIIIEKFIEKKHRFIVGGDIFIAQGRIIQWGLMNNQRDQNVNSLVPVGESYPALIDEEDRERVKRELQRLVTELDFQYGPMNIELIVDENNDVFFIDVGPRSGGNMIPDLLGMVFDCDVVEMSVRAAMGEDVSFNAETGHLFYATHNLHSDRDGIFEGIQYSEEIERFIVRKCLYKRPGDEVFYFDNASKALGIVFLKFGSMEQMLDILQNINQHIRPIVKGKKS